MPEYKTTTSVEKQKTKKSVPFIFIYDCAQGIVKEYYTSFLLFTSVLLYKKKNEKNSRKKEFYEQIELAVS